jgi:hypothetical protein
MDLGLVGAAAAGVAGELASLIYVAIRAGQGQRVLIWTPLRCGLFPLAAGTAAASFMTLLPASPSAWLILPVTIVAGAVCMLAGLAAMPAARGFIEGWIDRKPAKTTPLEEQVYVTTRA